MYQKPRLERFGTLRELTQFGYWADGSGWFSWWWHHDNWYDHFHNNRS